MQNNNNDWAPVYDEDDKPVITTAGYVRVQGNLVLVVQTSQGDRVLSQTFEPADAH